MEKMTVRELQCKLYIENLREKYMNRDFMFTTIGKEKMSRITQNIEMKVKEIEEQEALSDDDLKKSLRDKLESVKDIRKDLERIKESWQKIFETSVRNCKDQDFALALLFTCWKKRFADENASNAAIIDSYILYKLVIESDDICTSVLKEYYSEYVSLNKTHVNLPYEEVFNLIYSYDKWDGKSVLEIDTDFFGKSTKVVSKEKEYIVTKVLRDLTGVESEVYCIDALSQLAQDESYDAIVAKLSSCKDQSLDGILDFFNKLVPLTNKSCGRIILIDTERKLASKEMYEFRKKMVEESLLEIYISGYDLFAYADVYILQAHNASENVEFNFVSRHQHYASVFDNFLTLHNKLSKEDVESIDYDFNATSDLLIGRQGRAYSFKDIFSVPKSGIEERKASGLHHVFQMKDMPHNLNEGIKTIADLDMCEISGSFKMLTENKLIIFIGDDKIQCCYVEASEDKPIFVGHHFAVLNLNTEILIPEYVQMLCAKGIMEKVFDSGYMKRSDYRYTNFEFDSYVGKDYTITPEEKILGISTMIQIPSCDQQRKEISDAKFINASAVERERALEMLLAEKTWLNEEHIRNIKHRIGNELVPVKNDVDAIYKLLRKYPEGITLDTIRGKNEKVSEILSRLSKCISAVSESLHDLTRTVDKGDLKPVDIVAVVKDFVNNAVSKQSFNINSKVPDEIIYVNGSTNMINSILRNIVDNAVRHGFVDKSRNDYAVLISIDKDGNGNCVLEVKNNGVPMNECARDIYFMRGRVAGLTGHSGIGGADVKETVNAMGGDVTLSLDEDAWSVCVRISLPIINFEKI